MSYLETLTARHRANIRYTPMLLQFWRGLSHGASYEALEQSWHAAVEAHRFAGFSGDWPAARVTGKKMLRLRAMVQARKGMRSRAQRSWFAEAVADYQAYTEFHGLEGVQ